MPDEQSMPLYKEYFHKHTYDDIKYRNLPLNFKIRYEEAFGYFRDGVYTQTKKGRLRDYRTPWILLEDTPDNARRFAWVFYNFNIYTTLNYYRENQVTKECFVDLAFDFDAPELRDAWRDTMRMSEFLQTKQVPYHLFFSGKKGFHIVIGYQVFNQEYQENNHLINKEMAKLMIQETGPLPTMDMAIYSSRRQLRLANSKHSGSGLFKVPITLDELATGPELILKLAQKRRGDFILPEINSQNEYLHNIYLQAKQNLARLPKYDVPEVDLSVLGGSYPPCIDECLKVGIVDTKKANRNETTMLLASFFKGQGMDMRNAQDKLVAHALGVLRRFSESSNQEIINSTKSCVASVYRSTKYYFNCHFARDKFKLRCDDTCRLYPKYKDIRCSRKLHYIKVEQSEPQPTYTVEEIREGICQQIDNYLADPQGRILLIKVPAGVGKTITTIQHLTFGKRRIFWVAGRKDLFSNIPEDLQFKWIQILGRHSGVYTEQGEELMPPNCQHAKVAHVLGNKNHNITERLCKRHCDLGIEKCEYFQQFHDRWYHWFVQQPFFFYTEDDFVSPFDLIVIDEDLLEGFKKETRITLDDIRQNYRLFLETKKDQKLKKILLHDLYILRGNPPQSDGRINENLDPGVKLLHIIGLVAQYNIPFGTSETGKLILDKIRDIAKETLGENIEDILRAITDPDVFDKEVKFEMEDESQIPLNFFSYLHEILSYEYFHKYPQNNLSRLFFQKQNVRTESGTVCLENFLLINKLEKQTRKPIIILDATGKKQLYEKLFEREVVEYAPQVKLENEIIQVYSSSNSKRSLSNPRHFQRYMEAVKKLVIQEHFTLVMSKEIYEDKIAAELASISPHAKVAHFFGIRGSNEFQDFNQVIIFGTPQYAEDELKKYASMLHYNEPRAVDTSIEYQHRPYLALAKNGRAPAQRVRTFRDSLLQAIFERSREDEIIQAVNRIRIVHDFKKRVIVLSNIPLPGLPISQLVSLEELCGEVTPRMLVEDLVRLSLEKLGFICFYSVIDPILNKNPLMGDEKAKHAKDWLKTKVGLEFPVWSENKLSLRTLRTYFPKVIGKLGLQKMKLISVNRNLERGYLDIYAYDAKKVEETLRAVGGWIDGRFSIEEYPKAQQDI
jgi:hypothetical protein